MLTPLGDSARSRRVRAAAAALAIGALGYAVLPQPDSRALTPTIYSWDVALAPVCLDGKFDVAVRVGSATVRGELRSNIDVKGHVKGSLELNDIVLNVSGKSTRVEGAVHVEFKAKSPGNKIEFTGDVFDGSRTLTGTTSGKGAIAPGDNTFTIDLTSAPALMATIECSVTEARGRLKGTGHVASCGQDEPLTASGKWGTDEVALTLKGKSFKFAGKGPGGQPEVDIDYTVKGFGATAAGTGLRLIRVEEPEPVEYPSIPGEFETDLAIPTIKPTSGNAPRGSFTISPALPAGLAIDPDTGWIAGVPSEVRGGTTYTVTVSNYAGSYSTTIGFATRIQRSRSLAPETRFLTDADYRHFLGRAEFGVRQLGAGQTTLTRVKSIGLDAFIDQMLVFPTNGPAETIALPELGNANFPSTAQLSRWWTSLMMNSTNPFQERLAFFWADRFAVSADALEVGEAHFMREYINLFRYEGNGNLRSLLLKMSRSGAMIKYLNGNLNTAEYPNENFAREFWELFTLGVGNSYTQADIVQGARAWTGWKLVTNPSTGFVTAEFDATLHDATAKQVLGQTVPAQSAADDFQAMVNLTLDNAPVSEFITARIFEHFGFPDPHPQLVTAMATSLEQNNYELKPFLKALFKSEAFFSTRARDALVKSPVDFSVGFIHSTGLKLTPATFQSLLTNLGQPPAMPPSVNGFPEGELWFSAQNMADRVNLLDTCINDTARQTSAGINVANILPPPGQRSAAQVVDAMTALLDLALNTGERQTCIDYMNASSVFDGSSQAEIDNRVRGLLFLLAQHPTYQLR